jgi:hypothetical protein
VLDELELGDKLKQFQEAAVSDTLTLLRLKAMDLRMLGLGREKIEQVLAKIQQLTVREEEVVTTASPLLEERNALKYGRLFIDRSASSFEYFQADFGAAVPLTSSPLVWVEPRTGCGLTAGTAQNLTGKFALVERCVNVLLDCSIINRPHGGFDT